MEMKRIVLYIMGQGGADAPYSANELWKETENCVRTLCGVSGSEHAICHSVFDGQRFVSTIGEAVGMVRANPSARHIHIDAMSLYCVFIINSSLSGEQWAECIRQAKMYIGNIGFNQVNYVSLVQKDNMNLTAEFCETLAGEGMATYVFQQMTSKGWSIISKAEEIKLLTHYAVLAGAGMLQINDGIYVGSYNRLSLMREDFEKIRRHFIVLALRGRLAVNAKDDSVLFADFIGQWFGQHKVTMDASLEMIQKALHEKVKGFFPERWNYSLLVSDKPEQTERNIEEFIRLNMNGERMDKFLKRFMDTDRQDTDQNVRKNTPEGVVYDWCQNFERVMNRNPGYYCAEVAAYLEKKLIPWLKRKATDLEDIRYEGHYDSAESDDIARTIDLAEKAIKPYVNRTAAVLLRAIAARTQEKARWIRERIEKCEEMIKENNWLLSEAEIGDNNHYAEDIIRAIEVYCQNNIHPDALENSRDYYGAPELVKGRWEKQIEFWGDSIRKGVANSDLIALLNNTTIAEFSGAVANLLKDDGYRLNPPVAKGVGTSSGLPTIVYLYSDQLMLTNGKALPGANAIGQPVRGLNNLLQFMMMPLVLLNAAEEAGHFEQRKTILSMLGDSQRLVFENGRSGAWETETDEEEALAGRAEANVEVREATAEAVGSNVKVTVPHGLKATTINCKLNGYNEDGTIRQPHYSRDVNIAVQLSFNLPLNGLYGRCSVQLTDTITPYEQTLYFDGPMIVKEFTKGKPGIFQKKARKLELDGESVTFKKVVFSLCGKNAPVIEARINPTAEKQKDKEFLYPIGEDRKWEVWVPEMFAESAALEANDEERMYELIEK